MLSNNLRQLISQIVKWPGVGFRTATRYTLYLAHLDRQERKLLIEALKKLDQLKFCSFCHYPIDSSNQKTLCPICFDPKRQNKTICIVEKETDLNAIEETKTHLGRYFIMGPAVLWFQSDNFKTRLKQLLLLLKKENIEEVILAVNPTTEGLALSDYLKKAIHRHRPKIKITTPRQGLPRGAELEYADPETLKKAIQDRAD